MQEKWTALLDAARRGPLVPKSPTVEFYLTRWLEDVVRPASHLVTQG